MKIVATKLSGVALVELKSYTDNRGSFTRWFCEYELESLLKGRRIIQANHSVTQCIGAIRGMHYQQTPYTETKLIRCIRGRVYDVVVDLRRNSETYLSWFGQELSAGDDRLLVVPEGCAHGFQVLEENSELLYLHTAPYQPKHEAGIRFNDPVIGIIWPLTPSDISERDRGHPLVISELSDFKVTR